MKDDFIHHPDKGCPQAKELGYDGSCLDCPFKECLQDNPSLTLAGLKKQERNKEIFRRWQAGESYDSLAQEFKVCQRTIERIITKRKSSAH